FRHTPLMIMVALVHRISGAPLATDDILAWEIQDTGLLHATPLFYSPVRRQSQGPTGGLHWPGPGSVRWCIPFQRGTHNAKTRRQCFSNPPRQPGNPVPA